MDRDDDDDLEDTGKRRPPRRLMGDDERALVGAHHRRTRTPHYGVPQETREDDTAPEMVLSRELTSVELQILHRLGMSPGNYVTMGDLTKILTRDQRKAEQYRSGSEELGRQMDELRRLLSTPPNAAVQDLQARADQTEEDVAKLRRLVRWLKRTAIAALIAAVGSIGALAEKVWSRAEAEGEAAIRLKHAEDEIKALREDLRQDRARLRRQQDQLDNDRNKD